MTQGDQKGLYHHVLEVLEVLVDQEDLDSGHGELGRKPSGPRPGDSKGGLGKTPDSQKVRPSQFQKWVKKYNGSADPYDHLATFRQVVRAKQITDLHTQVEGFGLTLEGKALSWFQTLEPEMFKKFEDLGK